MTTKKAANAARIEANKQEAWMKQVRIATGHIFSRMDREAAWAAYKAGTSHEAYAAQLASAEPVGRALHPRKADAIAAAEERARKSIEANLAKLEAAGWDLNVLAPYPDSGKHGRETYIAMRDAHNYYSMITEQDPTSAHRRMRDPDIRRRSHKNEQRAIDMAKKAAAFQYDKFICKMVAKIGEGATDASIEGNHIWGNSILTVEMADGSQQRWHTKQIWNVSCLGKDFPQWPSRLMK